jgi:hypothetical protein
VSDLSSRAAPHHIDIANSATLSMVGNRGVGLFIESSVKRSRDAAHIMVASHPECEI